MEGLEKDFVTYNFALRMQQIGFNEPCFGYFDGNHNLQYMFSGKPEKFSDSRMGVSDSQTVGWVSAPTFSQAFRWFREKYNINFTIITNYAKIDSKTIKSYRVGIVLVEGKKINSFFLRPKKDSFEFLEFKTYEEAELECLDKLIELVESELK